MTWFVNVTCIMLWSAWIACAVFAWIKTGREARQRRQREFQQWQGMYEPLSLPKYEDLNRTAWNPETAARFDL